MFDSIVCWCNWRWQCSGPYWTSSHLVSPPSTIKSRDHETQHKGGVLEEGVGGDQPRHQYQKWVSVYSFTFDDIQIKINMLNIFFVRRSLWGVPWKTSKTKVSFLSRCWDFTRCISPGDRDRKFVCYLHLTDSGWQPTRSPIPHLQRSGKGNIPQTSSHGSTDICQSIASKPLRKLEMSGEFFGANYRFIA